MVRRVLALTAAGGLAATAAAFAATPAAATSTVALQGTLAGSYTTMQTNPDMGRGYKVTGSGHTSLGATTGKGSVHGPGNVAIGRCSASLTLTTSKGTLSVSATGTKTVKSFADCQSGFAVKWHTTKATGAYAGKSGSGTGTVTLVKSGNASSSPPPFYVTFDPES